MPLFVAHFIAVFGLLLCIAPAHAEAIKLEQDSGVYKLPVRINDAVTVPFVLDSGAAEVSIPADVFLVLLRGQSVSEADHLGSSKYTIADGSTVTSERYRLHKMSVGDHVITDVVANVVPVVGEPLLGQSFLGRLPSWTFDNTRHALVIGEGETKTATVEIPRKPAASADENASAAICGQSIPAPRSSIVMIGSWRRSKGPPLCAGFVAVAVSKSDDSDSYKAEAEYVYGKGTRLHLTGEYDDVTKAFTFHDQQGSTFTFWLNGLASFRGGSGQLTGNFTHEGPTSSTGVISQPASAASARAPAPADTKAQSAELFISTGLWNIYYDSGINNCFMATSYPDGTIFRFTYGLNFSYAEIGNRNWQSLRPGKEYPILLQIGNQTPWHGNAQAWQSSHLVFLAFHSSGTPGAELLKEIASQPSFSITYNDRQVGKWQIYGSLASLKMVSDCQDARVRKGVNNDPFQRGISDPFAK